MWRPHVPEWAVDVPLCTSDDESANGAEWRSKQNPRRLPVPHIKVRLVAAGAAHTVIVTERNEVFGCGANESGQLGIGNCNDIGALVRAERTKATADWITAVSVGKGHTLIQSGASLYGCGSCDLLSYWRFARERGRCLSRFTELQENIQAMCAGETCTAWISNNTLYVNGSGVWDDYSYSSGIPIRVSRGDNCKSLAVGEEHAMVVTQRGMLFGIGINDRGQFGTNEGSRDLMFLIPVPWGVREVACGGSSTMIITDDGTVMAAGANSFGELGVGDTDHRTYFVGSRNLPAETRARSVSISRTHAIVICEDGTAWCTKPLGRVGECKQMPQFERSASQFEYVGGGFSSACAGGKHSLLNLECGAVLSAGVNDHGQLGHQSRCMDVMDGTTPRVWSPKANLLFPLFVRQRIITIVLLRSEEHSLLRALPIELLFIVLEMAFSVT